MRIALSAAFFASAALLAVSPVPPRLTRPYEVVAGELRRRCPEMVGADKDGLGAFTLEGPGKLTLSDEFACFGDRAYKVDIEQGGAFFARLRKPVKFTSRIDGFEFWLIGTMKGVFTDPKFVLTDGNGKTIHLIPNNNCLWGNTSWWTGCIAFLPRDVVFPVTFRGIRFKVDSKGAGDCFYFDSIGAFRKPPVDLPDTRFWLPFPHDPAGITPRPQDPAAKVSCSFTGPQYTFSYQGKDGEVRYAYTPKTGTLSDLTATIGGKTFQPARDAGFRARVNQVEFVPGDSAVKATLVALVKQPGWLRTFWRLEKAGEHLDYELSLSLSGRTLTAEFFSESLQIRSLDQGYAAGLEKPRLFTLTNLGNAHGYVHLLACKDLLLSVCCDWYYSNASALVDDKPYRVEAHGVPGPALMQQVPPLAGVIDANSARLAAGAIYLPKTDGRRNAPRELLRITVGPTLESVMPRNPNPRSKFYDETAHLIYMTRSYCIGDLSSRANELSMIRKLHAYGARDLFLRYHTELSHIPAQNFVRLSRTFEGPLDMGGRNGLRDFIAEARKYVKRIGPYENHLALAAIAPEFRYNILSLCPGNYMPWSLRIKPAAMHQVQADFSPRYARFYGWNGVYYDQMSAMSPWAITDYDADAPGAARFSEVHRNNCIVTDQLGRHYDGPVWSEGAANHFYAGYLDTAYNQTMHPWEPHLVDYSLREMNAIMHACGFDLVRQGTEKGQAGIDFLLASQAALGSMGHIRDGINGNSYFGGFKHQPAVWHNMLKSYFMFRQLQELYAFAKPDQILYAVDGREVTATEMLREGLENQSMLHTVYGNGLHVWTNLHPEKNWTVTVDGRPITLPPNGYAAFLPGRILEYSALQNGRRVDYSKGEMYTYVDARGASAEFPGLKVQRGAYLLEKRGGDLHLIPLPFEQEESIGGLQYKQAIPCDQDGKPCGAPIPLRGGQFTTVKTAFSYVLK